MAAFGESSFLEKGFLSRALVGFITRCPASFLAPLFFYNLAETSLREKYSRTTLNGAGVSI